MGDLRAQILSYLAGIWRRRWYGVLIAWLVCMIGWVAVATLPNRYEAEARIYVDTETMLKPLLRNLTIQGNTDQQIAIMQRTLMSRPNLEQVMRMTDVDLSVSDQQQKDALIADFTRRIAIRSAGAKNLFSITFNDPDPELARRVVQALLSIFVESNLGDSRRDMQSAQNFIDAQIKDYERKLQDAERRVAEFKQNNLDILPNASSFAASSASATSNLQQAQRELENATIRRDNLRKQLASTPQFLELETTPQVIIQGQPTSNLPPAAAELRTRIQDLQKQLDGLMLRYTDQHPDVVATRKSIDVLNQQFEVEMKNADRPSSSGGSSRPRAGSGRNTVPNPLYDQLRIRSIEEESTATMLQKRVDQAGQEVDRLRQMMQKVPEIEAQFSNLDRDYTVIKKQYEELLARRESARLSQAVDDKADSFQFRIVDPPRTPTIPVGPNRTLFFSMVLVAGIGAGVAFALALTQIDDSFATASALRRTFNFPVLGSVSSLATAADRKKQFIGVVSFGVACTFLFLIYGGMLLLIPKLPFGGAGMI
jgi:polysaccharide chain length determinant protein (PEP-CTERM system associated)